MGDQGELCLLQGSTKPHLHGSDKWTSASTHGHQHSMKPEKHRASLMQAHGKHKWVDHGNFKATKMDQATLPADSRHVKMKTMTADWHQEYPTAAPLKTMKPIKGAACDHSLSLLILTIVSIGTMLVA